LYKPPKDSMSRTDQRVTAGQLTTRILGFISLLLLCGILYAGLKPFHSPANEVTWVAKANALRFGEYGTILSSGSLPLLPQAAPITVWRSG
jgi:hypothetical protein